MPRQDILTLVHKGIRAMVYDLGGRLMRANFADDEQRVGLLTRLRRALDMLAQHGRDEEAFILPELRRHAPPTCEMFVQEHRRIHERILDVEEALSQLEARKNGEDRVVEGDALNRAFNELVAVYLDHMNHEERVLLPALWDAFGDAELAAMRGRIQAAMHPERYAEWLHWMLGAGHDHELGAVFRGMKAGAPPAVLERTAAIAEVTLGPDRWQAVQRLAGLQPTEA